jgi:hypothetical protein
VARLLAAIAMATTAVIAVEPASAADLPRGPTQLEFVGFELTPFSLNYSSPDRGSRPSPFQAGLGFALRLGKLHWTRVYWTIAQAGFFVSGDSNDPDTAFVHVQTEVGVSIRTTAHAFELGLGAGAGLLAIHHGGLNDCNETCRAGGGAVLASPVGRWRFRDAAPSVALVARAEVVALDTGVTCWGVQCTGRATLFLVGLDMGFGPTPPAPQPAPASAPPVQAD